jgi:GNAT superfamily N-acetyltransferase
MVERYLARPGETCIFVADRAGEIAGMLGGYLDGYFFCDVTIASDTFFYVTPALRGHGVGSALLAAFSGWARARGARRVSLAVTSGVDDEAVARRYAALGFVPAGYLYQRELG